MTAELFATLLGILSFLAFFLTVIGLFKPTWVIRRPSLQTRKGVFLVWGVLWLCLGAVSAMVSNYAVSDEPIMESATAGHKLYVKVDTANIRQCPLPTCTVVSTFNLNSLVTTSANSLAEAPEWIEITYDADPSTGEQLATGFINKVTLAEEPVSASKDGGSQPPQGRRSSSVGGITIGPWGDIETTVGESYEFHFCEPTSAISGATCGGLADKATDPRGGTPPYSFVKKSGFLPQGMTLELNSTLKGTPAQEGTYNFRLCAKDLYGGEGCQDLLVVVKKAGTSPVNKAPVESTDVDLAIDSATCSLVYQDDYDRLVFSVSMSGTASGSVGTYLSFWSAPPDDKRYVAAEAYSILAGVSAQVNSGSWTAEYRDRTYSNKRAAGDPATTAWTIRGQTVHLYNASTQSSAMTRVNVSVRDDGSVPTKEVELFKDILCPS